jgi:hypothetical protein
MKISHDRMVGLAVKLTRDRVPFCVTYTEEHAHVSDRPGDSADVYPTMPEGKRQDRRHVAGS